MTANCKNCGAPMKDVFVSQACSAECDLKDGNPHTHRPMIETYRCVETVTGLVWVKLPPNRRGQRLKYFVG